MINLFTKSEFTKNTAILVVGTVLAQAVPIVLSPFLRRMYTPEDFGAMNVFLSIFGMITIISSLRYESTIVLPKNDHQAANIFGLTIVINFIINLLIFFGVLLFKEAIVTIIGLPTKYANYLYLLPVTSFLFSAYQSINYWLIRQKAFKASSTNKIVRRVVEGITQLVMGLFKLPGGLFIGDFLGNFSNVLSGIRQLMKTRFSLSVISQRKINFVSKKYNDYPKYNALPTFLSSAATLLPFLFINKFYSTEMVGYLDLSKMALSIPLVFISTTIAQVLFQQITEYKHLKQSVKSILYKVLYFLLIIVALEVLVLFLFGDDLFKVIFGEKYILSSYFSKLLIISFSFNFLASTFSAVYLTFNKIRINSIRQLFYFLTICSLYFFRELTLFDFLKVYVLFEVIMSLINMAMIFFIVRAYERSIVRLVN